MDKDYLNALLIQLASEVANDAEDAQREIESVFGTSAITPVLEIFSNLDVFSRRCAIELISNVLAKEPNYRKFEEIETALIPYLQSDDPVTREWIADILANIGTNISITPLSNLLVRLKKQGIPPDWTEPVSVRGALRKLGAMPRVYPDIAASKVLLDKVLGELWRVGDTEPVLRALAEQFQVIINFQIWEYRNQRYSWVSIKGNCNDLDFGKDWPTIVTESLENALSKLEKVKYDNRHCATFDWLSQKDIEPA